MKEDGEAAVRAIKKMASDLIVLQALDERAAVEGSRPLEQVADWNPLGWGGAVDWGNPAWGGVAADTSVNMESRTTSSGAEAEPGAASRTMDTPRTSAGSRARAGAG